MPHWSTTPPPAADGLALRIVRTPATRAVDAIATAPDFVGCCTHYAGNRTVPCEGPEACPWCADGHSWRWHGYLSAILTGTLEHILFEFTAAASDTFRNYYLLHGSMRACQFKAHRPSGRTNGRVLIACKRLDQQTLRLPDPPNVKKILCHIWGCQYEPDLSYCNPDRLGKQIGVLPGNGDARNRPRIAPDT